MLFQRMDEENLMDTSSDYKGHLKEGGVSFTNSKSGNSKEEQSHSPNSKVQKLITALYMVTDIMDKHEPIRQKLRTLGTDILSDKSITRTRLIGHIREVLSFLDIAFTMNMISEMNKNILVNEFNKFQKSLASKQDHPDWLEEFLKELPPPNPLLDQGGGNYHPLTPSLTKEGGNSTRIGVQKGSTLMKALSEKIDSGELSAGEKRTRDREMFKKQRREKIMEIIKNKGGEASVQEIREGLEITSSGGKKALQRKLNAMVEYKMIKKVGSKRWTRYRILR